MLLHGEANEGKALLMEYCGKTYARIPVRTHLLTPKDQVVDVAKTYLSPILEPGDVIFFSEKAVSCMQDRAVLIKDVKPRWLAQKLSRFVYKNPYGPGLGMPETMELVLREVGTPRVLFAGVISLIGKLFGQRGWFYNVAGDKARIIDTPDPLTIPPYNEYIVLAPLSVVETAQEIAAAVGAPVTIVDINDLGANVLGSSHKELSNKWVIGLLKDNPLGQANQQTPIGIIREVHPN